ncbi:hypothetical protein BMS3Abin16_00386 [archaeon BMS3Abin16]|nr:hypothetical protein BMS3Abin16_00386 [archaeon BMS3Abin16]
MNTSFGMGMSESMGGAGKNMLRSVSVSSRTLPSSERIMFTVVLGVKGGLGSLLFSILKSLRISSFERKRMFLPDASLPFITSSDANLKSIS